MVDTHLILQHVDETVGPERALWPKSPAEKRQALGLMGLASGLADKVVGLFYELRLHKEVSPAFTARWRRQIEETLTQLEISCAERTGPWWFGAAMTHADVALGATLQHLKDSHPDIAAASRPALEAFAARCEGLEVFRAIRQEFIPPA